jgi:hypothetical protein
LRFRYDPKPGDDPRTARKKKLMSLLCYAANAIVVVVTAALAYVLHINDLRPFPITGDMPAGVPDVAVPSFGYNDTNGTYHGFAEVVGTIGEGIAVIPILAVLESISIAKAFGQSKNPSLIIKHIHELIMKHIHVRKRLAIHLLLETKIHKKDPSY